MLSSTWQGHVGVSLAFQPISFIAEHHGPKYEVILATQIDGYTFLHALWDLDPLYRFSSILNLQEICCVFYDFLADIIICYKLCFAPKQVERQLCGSSLSLLITEWHQKAKRRNAGRECLKLQLSVEALSCSSAASAHISPDLSAGCGVQVTKEESELFLICVWEKKSGLPTPESFSQNTLSFGGVLALVFSNA